MAHAERAKQIADRIVGGKAVQAEKRMQGAISPQQTGVSEAPGPHQHRYQEGCKSGSRIDMIGRTPANRHVLPNRFHQADLVQESYENCNPAEWRYGSLRLAQNQSLILQQGVDLAPDWFVRCL